MDAARPEDVGGPWGYAELLEAIHDPKHERHVDLSDWIPENFDPNDADTDALAPEVAMLAKKWLRKPDNKRTRRS